MPHSDDNTVSETDSPPPEGKGLAVIAQALYLLNLLFPILPMLGLAGVYISRRRTAAVLAMNHLGQALAGALISTTLFILANLIIVIQGGYRSVTALIVFEVYFVVVVPIMLIPGLMALIKAMAGEPFRYPLIGRFGKPGD
ncbi:MAG: hypothetical protein ABW116_09520 [Candidatus Sedimenticola sp. 20ELBAFRAG]